MTELRKVIGDCKTADDFTKATTVISGADGLTNGAALKLKHELIDAAKAAGFVYDRASASFINEPEKPAVDKPAEAE